MDADGAGQRRVGARGHVEGQHLAALDELVKGRQVAAQGDRREGRVVGAVRVGRLLVGRSLEPRRVGRGRAKDARDGRQVEHAEEHGHAFDDARTNLVVEGVPVVDVPAIHGFHAEPDLLRAGTLNPLTLVRDFVVFEVLARGRVRFGLVARLVGRVRLKPEGSQRGQVVAGYVRRRDADPLVGHVGRVGLRLFDLLGEQRLVDGAMVDVTQRHPSGRVAAVLGRQHPVQLDDPADEVGVRLLPKGFFPPCRRVDSRGTRPVYASEYESSHVALSGFHVSRPSRLSSM